MRTIVHDVEADTGGDQGHRDASQQTPGHGKQVKGQQDVQGEKRAQQDNRFDQQFMATMDRKTVLFKVTLHTLLQVNVER